MEISNGISNGKSPTDIPSPLAGRRRPLGINTLLDHCVDGPTRWIPRAQIQHVAWGLSLLVIPISAGLFSAAIGHRWLTPALVLLGTILLYHRVYLRLKEL